MRTPDMSDEELDALFQRGAEKYPDEYNLSAWLQMERKLEEAAAAQLVQRRVLRIFALEAVVLLVALLGWLGFSSSDTERLPQDAPTELAILPAVPSPPAAAGHAPQPAAGAATLPALAAQPAIGARPTPPSTTQEVSKIEKDAVAIPHSTLATRHITRHASTAIVGVERRRKPQIVVPSEALASSSVAAAPTRTTHSEPQASPRRNRRVAVLPTRPQSITRGSHVSELSAKPAVATAEPAGRATTIAPAPASSATGVPAAETVAPEAAVAAATRPESEPLSDRTSGATHADSAATPALATADLLPTVPVVTPADSIPEKPSRVKPAYRASIGLLYAPELSTVGWVQKAGLGSNLGVQLEYRFTDRLRVNVAALRSVKRYAARGSDYHPPAGYWTNYYTIDEVDATCNITDVPINLRYDVLRRTNASAFASVGLSTLLMRNEQYRYGYDYNGKYVVRDWSLAKGSNHLLSVLNLSVGYERSLRGRWSAQGEPFVKIPLGGVGFGKVKLSSAGVFFSLKYSLLPMAPR